MPPEGREYERCLSAVVTAIQAFDEEKDLSGALRRSFEELACGFGAQKALLLAVEGGSDPATVRLKNVYASGLRVEQIRALEAGESLPGVSHSIIREAIETQTVRLMEHPAFHRKAGITKAFTAHDDFSVLCAPIFDPERKRVTAVMYFHNSGHDYERAYHAYDVKFLEPYREALQRVLHLEFEKQSTRRQYEDLLEGQQRPEEAPEIVGVSPDTAALRRAVHETWIPAMDGEDPAPILIRGESGTGKGLLARYLHAWSARRNKPFTAVNAGSIDTNPAMATSAFHGHTRNAYTGATQAEPGYLRAAHRGVLFIDEVGELSEQGQLTLLRFLDNSKVAPLGDTKEYPVDVMVILATNRDLDEAVKEGRMRRDFLARFETQTILLPPLRERPADIRPLLDHFIREREQRAKKRTLGITDGALQALLSYSWPNNVRELYETSKLLITHVRPAGRIDLELLERVYPRAVTGDRNPRSGQVVPGRGPTLKEARDTFTRDMVRARLEHFEGNMSKVAESLGVERTHLYRLLERMGLKEGHVRAHAGRA